MNNYDLNWKIGMVRLSTGEEEYYIYAYVNDKETRYMHRNGTIHNLCGNLGFFKTREEAEQLLPWQKIPDELFEI